MRDNTAIHTEILGALSGSTDRAKIIGLAQQAGEFVDFYAQLTVRLTTTTEYSDQEPDETHYDRLDLGRIGRNGNEHVAQEVVNFLQELSVQVTFSKD